MPANSRKPQTKSLKIGLVLDETLDKPDGVQQYVQTVGRWLTEQGHEVHYLVGDTSRTDYPNIHSVAKLMSVRFNGNKLFTPLPTSTTKIRRLLSELQLDVLHVQTPHSPFFAQKVITSAPERTAIVATFHILPYDWTVTAGMRGLAVLLRPSFRRIQRLFAVSPAAQKFIEATCHVPCEVLPNPIKLKNFKGAKGFPEYADMPTIVYLNRLVVRKGAMHLLRAACYVRDHKLYEQPFRVVVCGKGEETPKLQRFIRDHKLDDIVTMTGFVSEEDKPRYLASADIAAYPSTGGESFGIVLLEGMASSKGVVLAGNNPGYASVMAPKPEQLIDPKDTAAFAALLAKYLADPAARAAAAQWQKDYVKRFDINVVGKELVRNYRACIAEKRLHSNSKRKYDTIES